MEYKYKYMEAFNNDPQLKTDLLKEIVWHREQDLILKGVYSTNEKYGVFHRGCAIGCALNSLNRVTGTNGSFDDHGRFEKELGIPNALAHLIDSIFEALPDEEAMLWPEKIVESIPVGADLSGVADSVKCWVLDEVYIMVEGLDIQQNLKTQILEANREVRNGPNGTYVAVSRADVGATDYAASYAASCVEEATYTSPVSASLCAASAVLCGAWISSEVGCDFSLKLSAKLIHLVGEK